MRTTLITLLIVATLSSAGCNRQSPVANQNTVSVAGKKPSPKEELIGHWRSLDKTYDYYFTADRVIAVGEIIEDQGLSRLEWTYKVLQTNEDDNNLLVQTSFNETSDAFAERKTTKYIFDGKGGMTVENYKGRKLDTSFQCQHVDAKQEP